MHHFNPLSRLFPQVIVLILAGMSVLLFVLSFVRPKETEVFGKETSYTVPTLSAVLMVVWVVSVAFIGFLLSTIIFFPLMVVLITSFRAKRKRLVKNCIIAVALIGIFYLLFGLILGVQFPAGKLGII